METIGGAYTDEHLVAMAEENARRRAKYNPAQAAQISNDVAQDGWVHQASAYWKQKREGALDDAASGKSGVATGVAKATLYTIMDKLIDISGLKSVEASAAELGTNNGLEAPDEEIAASTGKLVGHSVLAGASFTPALGVAKGLKVAKEAKNAAAAGKEALSTEAARLGNAEVRQAAAKQAEKVAANDGVAVGTGTPVNVAAQDAAKVAQVQTGNGGSGLKLWGGGKVKGMTPAHDLAAGRVERDLTKALDDLPRTGEASKAQLETTFGKLQTLAKKYGVDLRKGGTLGETTGDTAQVVTVNLEKGGAHELTHAVQMLQTRMTALESKAIRSGKDVKELLKNPDEVSAAYTEMVYPFEKQTVGFHESYAYKATGYGGNAKNAERYRETLLENLKAQGEGLRTGTQPQWAEGIGAKIYGEAPRVVGYSQGEIAAKVLPPGPMVYNHESAR